MKSYTQEELNAILERHEMWLNNKRGGKQADLRWANLYGMNLSSTDLRFANFQGSSLSLVNLEDANLKSANFQGVNLKGAILRGANLRDTDLRGADLQNADLRGVSLQRSVLENVRLPEGFYQVVGCGSKKRCTTYDSINDQVIRGCWDDDKGNHLDSFRRRVENIYGECGEIPNKKYYNEYAAAIAFFEARRKVEEIPAEQ